MRFGGAFLHQEALLMLKIIRRGLRGLIQTGVSTKSLNTGCHYQRRRSHDHRAEGACIIEFRGSRDNRAKLAMETKAADRS